MFSLASCIRFLPATLQQPSEAAQYDHDGSCAPEPSNLGMEWTFGNFNPRRFVSTISTTG